MIQRQITYPALQQQVTKRCVSLFLWKGMGVPLACVSAVTSGALWIVASEPKAALILIVAMSALGVLKVILDLRDPKVRGPALVAVVAKLVPPGVILDLSLRREVQTGMETFGEIAQQITEIDKRHGENPYFQRVLDHACGLMILQQRLARRADELEAEEQPELHQEEALQAGTVAHEALIQLEAMATVLRALQQTSPSQDVAAGAIELAREAEETLRRLKARATDPGGDGFPPEQLAPVNPPGPSGSASVIHPVAPRPAVPALSDHAWHRLADRYSSPELAQLRETLLRRLAGLNSAGGLKALSGLVLEYAQLRRMLARRADAGSLILSQAPALAEEAYRQGLSVLGDALEIIEATSGPQREQLEQETLELEERLAAAQDADPQPGSLGQIQNQLALNQERLEPVRRQRLLLEQLLNQCRRCEVSLDLTRVEMAGLRADSSESRIGEATETLRKAIEQAREVQAELKQSGW